MAFKRSTVRRLENWRWEVTEGRKEEAGRSLVGEVAGWNPPDAETTVVGKVSEDDSVKILESRADCEVQVTLNEVFHDNARGCRCERGSGFVFILGAAKEDPRRSALALLDESLRMQRELEAELDRRIHTAPVRKPSGRPPAGHFWDGWAVDENNDGQIGAWITSGGPADGRARVIHGEKNKKRQAEATEWREEAARCKAARAEEVRRRSPARTRASAAHTPGSDPDWQARQQWQERREAVVCDGVTLYDFELNQICLEGASVPGFRFYGKPCARCVCRCSASLSAVTQSPVISRDLAGARRCSRCEGTR